MIPLATLEDYGLSELTLEAFDLVGIVYFEDLLGHTSESLSKLNRISEGRITQLIEALNRFDRGESKIDPERVQIEERYQQVLRGKIATESRLEASMKSSLVLGTEFVREVFGPDVFHQTQV